jgi:hypothetical protein
MMPLDGTNFTQQDAMLDLLRRARDRIARPGGWCQRTGYGFGGANCPMAALQIEREYGFDIYPAVELIAAELPGSECHPIKIVAFNDTTGRTQAEVVALFDAVIANREAELQTGGG